MENDTDEIERKKNGARTKRREGSWKHRVLESSSFRFGIRMMKSRASSSPVLVPHAMVINSSRSPPDSLCPEAFEGSEYGAASGLPAVSVGGQGSRVRAPARAPLSLARRTCPAPSLPRGRAGDVCLSVVFPDADAHTHTDI